MINPTNIIHLEQLSKLTEEDLSKLLRDEMNTLIDAEIDIEDIEEFEKKKCLKQAEDYEALMDQESRELFPEYNRDKTEPGYPVPTTPVARADLTD